MGSEMCIRDRRNTVPSEYDGQFVRRVSAVSVRGLQRRDQALLDRISKRPKPLVDVINARIELQSLSRLVGLGLLQISAVTPSDASHVLKKALLWDCKAAEKGLLLFARCRTGSGEPLAHNATEMAKIIINQLTQQTVRALLEVAFAEAVSYTHLTLPPPPFV